MTRISEKKVVLNSDNHIKLLSDYQCCLKQLIEKYPYKTKLEFSELVNFKKNKSISKHRWYDYKQGYAAELMKLIISKENINKDLYVLDPFTGVGTTNLVAQELGYKNIGIDVNPIASLAARVKTYFFSENEIEDIETSIKNFIPKKTYHIPDSTLLVKSFPLQVFSQLMEVKGFYEQFENQKINEFFKLAYISIIDECSTRIKDGNGLKIAKNKKIVNDVFELYLNKCKEMIGDLKSNNYSTESLIIDGSLLKEETYNKIKDKNVGLVVFSPPYANCFDYCEVYKLELWMGDFVLNYKDFKKYRDLAMRSHVNSQFVHVFENNNNKVDLIANLLACYNLWNKNIPDMVRGYFDDMENLLKKLHKLMVNNSKVYIIVANSGYKGILVPTDLLIVDIAERTGFFVKEIIQARKIRSSSQQMDELNGNYENLMRESIIVLQRQ